MNQQPEKTLASYVGKLLRQTFGKGPESIFVTLSNDFIIIYIRNFITPVEKVLLSQKQEESVLNLRYNLMKTLIPEICSYLNLSLDVEVKEFYYDWSLDKQTGIFACVLNPCLEDTPHYPEKEPLHEEISRISTLCQKPPVRIESTWLNPRTLVIVREGILIRIEKEIIRMHQSEMLRLAKRNLEKSFFHHDFFDEILHTEVIDIFVDWDFQTDKSIIIFITQPKN